MEISVRNQNGDTVETIDLDDAVFNVPMNQSLVHQALVIYQLNRRHGTHDTKTRAQVSGGGRKPWRQKHTGRARQGSIRAPQWRHGGVVFGPHPRSYRKSLPRRMRRLALKCVLSDKARQERLVCLDSIDTVDGKTRSMVDLLQKLEVSGSTLIVTRSPEEPVIRAAHNLGKVWTLPVELLNAHELLRRETVIMTLEAARWAEQVLALAPPKRGGPQDEGPLAIIDTSDAPTEQEAEEDPEIADGPEEAEDPAAELAILDEEVEERTEESEDPAAELEVPEEPGGETDDQTDAESLADETEEMPKEEADAATSPEAAVPSDEEEVVPEEEAEE